MYIIGNQSFKTQKEIKLFINQMCRTHGLGNVKIDSSEHHFFTELLKRHPYFENKKGTGIDFFIINLNHYSRYVCYNITFNRTDGSVDEFSWNLCISGKPKTLKNETINAMRNAIHIQIKNFKQTVKQECNICHIKNVDFDCDHYGLEFKQLSETFIKKYGLCSTIKSGGCFTSFDNKRYNDDWINYHNSNAQLLRFRFSWCPNGFVRALLHLRLR
jgi:hypothetical protein